MKWLLLDKGVPVLLAGAIGWVSYRLGRASERVEWLTGRRSTFAKLRVHGDPQTTERYLKGAPRG